MASIASEVRKAEFKLDATNRSIELGLDDDELMECLLDMAYFNHVRLANMRRDGRAFGPVNHAHS